MKLAQAFLTVALSLFAFNTSAEITKTNIGSSFMGIPLKKTFNKDDHKNVSYPIDERISVRVTTPKNVFKIVNVSLTDKDVPFVVESCIDSLSEPEIDLETVITMLKRKYGDFDSFKMFSSFDGTSLISVNDYSIRVQAVTELEITETCVRLIDTTNFPEQNTNHAHDKLFNEI